MREITTHRVEGDTNEGLRILAVDPPGPGGANHVYAICGMHLPENDAAVAVTDEQEAELAKIDGDAGTIIFQCGGIPDKGVNGVTNEALLALVKDRLEAFQAGPFAAQENATALSNVNEALRALHKRTQARIKRGVEGQMVA